MHFRDLIGQGAAVERILEAIKADRFPHAQLVTGPDGIGKLALATAIAQYVNCLSPEGNDSCGRCSNCKKISKGIHPDVRYIYPIISKKEGGKQLLSEDYGLQFREMFFAEPYASAAQWQRSLGGESKQLMISVHEIRELKRKIYLKAFEAPFKVIILWQAELINNQGANAFLKLLEEPPEKTLILMTSNAPQQLITTITSRCQRIHLPRIPAEAIQTYLMHQRALAAEDAEALAAVAEGSIGNALEYTEESYKAINEQYMNWLRAVYTGNYSKITEQTEPLIKSSKEYQKLFLKAATRKLRDALMYNQSLEELALSVNEEKQFQQKFSPFVSPAKVGKITSLLEGAHKHISGNANAQMVFSSLSMSVFQIMRAS